MQKLIALLILIYIAYYIYEKHRIWKLLEHFPQDEAEFNRDIKELMEWNRKCKN